jgi:hypothetical protein
MLLRYVVTLNHYLVLFGYDTQYSAGGAFMVAGNNLNSVTFLYMSSHL